MQADEGSKAMHRFAGRRGWLTLLAIAAAVPVVVLAACGGSSSSTKTVAVGLSEYTVKPQQDTAKPGKLAITARNDGGIQHELVLVKVAQPQSLPTKPDGSVDESKIPAKEKAGEIDDVAPGASKSHTFSLSSGTYTMFCNIVDKAADGTVISHFAKGMSTTFVVQ